MCDLFQMQESAKAYFEKSREEVALNHIAMEISTGDGGLK